MPKPFLPVASIATALALALTACSGSSSSPTDATVAVDEPEASTFEFQTPSYGSEGQLTIRIPDDLVAAAGSDADGLVVTSVDAVARELDSSSHCAVDLTLTYADGGLESAQKPRGTEEEHNAIVEAEIAAEMQIQFGVSTVEEARAIGREGIEYDEYYVEQVLAEMEEIREYFGPYIATSSWNVLDSPSTQDLDPADPDSDTYISDDATVLTLVSDCAESPMDDSSTSRVEFPVIRENMNSNFATVELSVMKSGTLTITEAEVRDYTRDSNGDWIGG